MLSLMRKHATSWLIKVLLGAIVIVFVFWGVGSFKNRKASQVAEVNGDIITIEEYRQSYNNLLENYRRQFGSSLDEAMLKMLKIDRQALDMLIDQRLVLQEAERLKIMVTEEELAASIRNVPVFQSNGSFDSRRYRLVLNNARLSPEEFEEGQKRQMISEKVRNLILDGVKVSEIELREQYNFENTEVNITYLALIKDNYTAIEPSDDEVTAYFEEKKEAYKTDPMVAAQYLKFDPKSYADRVKIDPEEIREYFESNPAEFKTEKSVEARHILFKVDEGADEALDAEKKTKALEVLELARGGEDFAELAKKYSEGPSKDTGGQLGEFTRERMVKPFADKAFAMQAGEISEPVKTQFGWHLIKVEKVNEATTQTLEEATAGIEAKLSGNKTKNMAYDEAEETYDAIFDSEDFTRLATEKGLTIVTTEAFTRSQGPKASQIGNRREFANVAFELPLQEISEVQDFSDGYYILQTTAKTAAEVPPLEEVREEVKADLVNSLQDEKARADAETLLTTLKGGGDMTAEGAQFDLTPEETGFFKRNGSIPILGYERDILSAAFALTAEKALSEEVITGTKGYYLIRLKERKIPDAAGFEAEKENIEKSLMEQKKRKAYEAWLSQLKERSDIAIEEKLFE